MFLIIIEGIVFMKCPKCGVDNNKKAKFCHECATSLLAPVETVTEEVIEDDKHYEGLIEALKAQYKIISEIGRGGMGIVYECKELSLDRTVALKVLPIELSYDKHFTERFKREIKILAKLHHPNIVPLYTANETGGFISFSMQYVNGRTLADIISKKDKLTIQFILNIALQIAKGLSYAHSENVLHRDLKPENIMVDDHLHVYIMDFGIARALGEIRTTRTNITIGTPEYMSPEQCSGEKESDGRSDIYSLGIILYEMLTGKKPFTGEAASIIYKQVFVQPETLKGQLKNIPQELTKLVDVCLEKKQEKRPANADEVIKILQHTLDEQNGLNAKALTKRKVAIISVVILLLFLCLFVWNRYHDYNQLVKGKGYNSSQSFRELRPMRSFRSYENQNQNSGKLLTFWNVITGKASYNEIRRRENEYQDMLDEKEDLKNQKEELESQIDEMNVD
jgi:serine/threonine protein kinase